MEVKDSPLVNPADSPLVNPADSPLVNPADSPLVNPADSPSINPANDSCANDEILTEYFKSKNFKLINITNLINLQTYLKYINLAIAKPNIVLYFNRNKINDFMFKPSNVLDVTNIYFINKNNALFLPFNGELTKNIKLLLNKFIEGKAECDICYDVDSKQEVCEQCGYKMCHKCLIKIANVVKREALCPQCRKSLEQVKFN
jgi:hypothetical protein